MTNTITNFLSGNGSDRIVLVFDWKGAIISFIVVNAIAFVSVVEKTPIT